MNRFALIGAFIVFLSPNFAFADNATGTITAIDQTTGIMTLDNGNTYNLPGEFDYSVLKDGMKVTVFYDTQGAKRYVNDIEPEDGSALSDDSDNLSDVPNEKKPNGGY